MRTCLIIIVMAFFCQTASAKLHSYTDDKGKVWYVSSPNDILPKYRNQSEPRVIQRDRTPLFQERARSNVRNSTPGNNVSSRGRRQLRQTAKKSTPLEEMLSDTLEVSQMQEGFEQREFLGIKIVGESFFVDRIEKALNILVERAPFEFKKIRLYVPIIKQGKRTMMWTELNPPVMTISVKSATHTTTFNAGIIAHESCHARLSLENKSADPSDYKAIQDEEMACINYEEQVMKKIGAPPQEMKMLRDQDGTHFDVNKDGKYDLEDFQEMDW